MSGYLPTAREQAKLSQSLGAKGILEVSGIDAQNPPYGYHKISVKNPDGKLDEFYYNYNNYKRPAGELGNFWFMSSSIRASNSNYTSGFNGIFGEIDYITRGWRKDAVRCIRAQ